MSSFWIFNLILLLLLYQILIDHFLIHNSLLTLILMLGVGDIETIVREIMIFNHLCSWISFLCSFTFSLPLQRICKLLFGAQILIYLYQILVFLFFYSHFMIIYSYLHQIIINNSHIIFNIFLNYFLIHFNNNLLYIISNKFI